jgi:CRP-like cAMP-binding protein
LSAEERAALSARARVQTYNAGEIIFSMSSAGNQMMALLSGTIRISLPLAQGKELFLAIIQPGEIFGELAVLDGHERSAGIKDVRIRFSQRDLANMVGSSRESVNKCLRNWQRKGVLRLSEGSITITNCRALEHIADLA